MVFAEPVLSATRGRRMRNTFPSVPEKEHNRQANPRGYGKTPRTALPDPCELRRGSWSRPCPATDAYTGWQYRNRQRRTQIVLEDRPCSAVRPQSGILG